MVFFSVRLLLLLLLLLLIGEGLDVLLFAVSVIGWTGWEAVVVVSRFRFSRSVERDASDGGNEADNDEDDADEEEEDEEEANDEEEADDEEDADRTTGLDRCSAASETDGDGFDDGTVAGTDDNDDEDDEEEDEETEAVDAAAAKFLSNEISSLLDDLIFCSLSEPDFNTRPPTTMCCAGGGKHSQYAQICSFRSSLLVAKPAGNTRSKD